MVPLPPPSNPGTSGPGLPPPAPGRTGALAPPPSSGPAPASAPSVAFAPPSTTLPAPARPEDRPPTGDLPTYTEARPKRRRRWWIALAVLATLLISAVIGASLIEVPYYGIAPGDARPIAPRIEVTGAPRFSSEGEVLFVTVSVPRLTALGAVVGWLDPDVDVVPERDILGDQSPEENRETNLRLMGYSKDFATYVALEKLGYEVRVSDGGVVIDSLCMAFRNDGSCQQEAPAATTLEEGDLITAIDNRPVNLAGDIAPALTGRAPGATVTVIVRREGESEPLALPVVLTKAEDDGRTILGILPNPSPPDTIKFEFPVNVSIDSGAVGGPSAGLAFTLALIDELTPGDLTAGKKIAATGTISPSGTVGPIGGLPQKTVAVEREGAEVFLVPKAEVAEAEAKAEGTGLKVVGVDTLDDALLALKAAGGSGLPAGVGQAAG
jgi:PDZ domain-containing protein